MRAEGVEPVVRSESLSVVGLVEVLRHIPRIYGEFRKLVAAALQRRPDLAILTDSPDFHLRLARKLFGLRIPVVYLVAPQVWAWRRGRVHTIRKTIKQLLCIFPFEEPFFRKYDVPAAYIGHPMARLVRARSTNAEFRSQHGIPDGAPLIALLPGSRPGEIARHLEPLADAVRLLRAERPDSVFIAGTPAGFSRMVNASSFWERFRRESIQIIEGWTWDLLAHADLALAASGTVTIEAALLGTPMVAFYRVSQLSWLIGRWLVRAPFLCMVNLVAGCAVVPELIQADMTPERLSSEALRLLKPDVAREQRSGLDEVRRLLSSGQDPMDRAVELIETVLNKETVNVR